MPGERHTRTLLLYFGALTLLGYVSAPDYLLDIPTTFLMKNRLEASAAQVSLYRLVIGIPLYIGFLFGLTRDLWSPLGLRDRGYLRVFPFVTIAVFIAMALLPFSYGLLLAGMLLAMISARFTAAATQGLMALIAQNALMAGRLSALQHMCTMGSIALVTFASGLITKASDPRATFLLAAAVTLPLALFGFLKPRAVFSDAYDTPNARGLDFRGDLKRLAKHRAVYPAVIMNLLWFFSPAMNTPLQFYLTNRLHASDTAYSNYLATFYFSLVPTTILYGFLCTRFKARKLLWCSAAIAVPQVLPILLVHSEQAAMVTAVVMGLTGGMAGSAFIDVAMRSCPPGLQGTLMMLVFSGTGFAMRGGDLMGSWLFGLSDQNGFLYCVLATTLAYALILAVIPFVPKDIIATADGERPH